MFIGLHSGQILCMLLSILGRMEVTCNNGDVFFFSRLPLFVHWGLDHWKEACIIFVVGDNEIHTYQCALYLINMDIINRKA